MPQAYKLVYLPDADPDWAVTPGACISMEGFAHDDFGTLKTINRRSTFGTFTITGTDTMHAEVFRGPSGTARFLAFRASDIDEYDNAGTRTSMASGITAGGSWEAASWGSQIIATNYTAAVKSSTGGVFTDLSGSPPKARHVAANVNFVMLADVNDGGSNNYADMVWWSGARNPATWTPSQATQAGNIRLLDTNGPIIRVVPFGDKFLVFKKDSIYLGTYVGPPHVFSWRVINDTIGLSYPKAVCALGGRVYFMHSSGVYSFDGQGFENIGLGVFSSITNDASQNADYSYLMYGDSVDGIVWIGSILEAVGATTTYHLYTHAYNTRARLWSRQGKICNSSTSATASPPIMVAGEQGEFYAFSSFWGVRGGFVYVDNAATSKVAMVNTNSALSTDSGTASFVTGYIGSQDFAAALTRVFIGGVYGSSPDLTVTLQGYSNNVGSTTYGYTAAATTAWNVKDGTFDGFLNSKYKTITVVVDAQRYIAVRGVGMTAEQAGRI